MKKKLLNSSSCIGFNYNNLKKLSLKHYKQNHKLCASCFNNCVEWTLNVSFNQDKILYSNVRKTIK